jgi:hypothetical protein
MMKLALSRTLLWAAAGLVFGAAVVTSLRSLALAPGAAERIARKESELAQLQRLQRDDESVRAALLAVESLGDEVLQSPTILPALPAAGVKPDDVRTETRSFGDGWSEVTTTATFREAPLRDVMALADVASAARPPWRLVSCDSRAAPRGAGTGQATLVLATVRRGSSGGRGK